MIALSWLHGERWPWLVGVPIALLLGAWLSSRAQRRTQRCLPHREHQLLGRRCHRRSRCLLAVGSVACAALAFLRPVSVGAAEGIGADVVLCLDVSRSMAAGDVAPSRFAAALAQIEALAKGAVGSRLSLVVFAGDAHLVAPLSADRQAVVRLAQEFAPGTVGQPGTRIDAAIRLAQQLLRRARVDGGAIVLMTDGEQFGGEALAAARAARDDGRRVDCVGFGSVGGSKIVVDDDPNDAAGGRFLRDAAGVEVVTRLDYEALRTIAEHGGGSCRRAASPQDLRALHDTELLPAAAESALQAGRIEPVPRHGLAVLSALLLWLLRVLLPERRR